MPSKRLDLSKGSIIHIEDFKSPGYPVKDKYLAIFGSESLTHVLAFTITTTDWTSHPRNGKEVVEIPQGTVSGLPKKCWVKCFYRSERLDVQELESGYANYVVSHKGKLPQDFLLKIKTVVEASDLLARMDIDDCLAALDRNIHEKKK